MDTVYLEAPSSPSSFQSSRKRSINTDGVSETASPASSHADDLALVLPKLYVSELNLAAYGLKSALEADLLRYIFQTFLPTLVSSHTHPGFLQQGSLLAPASKSRPLIEALLAMSSLHSSSNVHSNNTKALGYYSNSIHVLREQVDSKAMTGSEDHLLIHVVWLYMFEVKNRSLSQYSFSTDREINRYGACAWGIFEVLLRTSKVHYRF